MKRVFNWMHILTLAFCMLFLGMLQTSAMAAQTVFVEGGEKRAEANLLPPNTLIQFIPRPAGSSFDQGVGGWFKILPTSSGTCVLKIQEGRSMMAAYHIYLYDANGDPMWDEYIEDPEVFHIDVTAGEPLYLRAEQGLIVSDWSTSISVCFPDTHEWQSMAKPIVTEASCISEGSSCNRECTLCGYRDIQVIPMTDHTPGSWCVETAATCNSAGEEVLRCTVCGTLLDTQTIPALEHEPGEGYTYEEPTHTEPGYQDVFCINCGEFMYTEEIPPIGFTVIAHGEQTTSDGYFRYEINDAGILTISGSGAIPDYGTLLSDYDLRAPWYEDFCYEVSEIIIENGITRIGNGAFEGMRYLQDVSIPSSVTSIGDYAFSSCWDLYQISIPDSVEEIGKNPFLDCSSLQEITLSVDHPSLATIDGVLFYKPDKKLISYPSIHNETVYRIPDGVEIIGDLAFAGNESIMEIVIPDSVQMIGCNPFLGCSNMSCISVSPDNVNIGTIENVLFDKKQKALICYPSIVGQYTYEVPNGILSIGDYAFAGNEELESIVLPQTVVSIGDFAFCGGIYLSTITIPASVTDIGESIVFSYDPATLIVERDSVAKEYANANDIVYTYIDANDWLND